MEKCFSERDVASRLGISQQTVNRWKHSGRLPQPIKRPGKPAMWTENQVALYVATEDGINEACATLANLRCVPGISKKLSDLIDLVGALLTDERLAQSEQLAVADLVMKLLSANGHRTSLSAKLKVPYKALMGLLRCKGQALDDAADLKDKLDKIGRT